MQFTYIYIYIYIYLHIQLAITIPSPNIKHPQLLRCDFCTTWILDRIGHDQVPVALRLATLMHTPLRPELCAADMLNAVGARL